LQAYKIDNTYANKIVVFFGIRSDEFGMLSAVDLLSHFLVVPVGCAPAMQVREWAVKQGFLEPDDSVADIELSEQLEKDGKDSNAWTK